MCHATDALPVRGWHVGREMSLWAFMLPLVCRLIAVHSLEFPFQQGYGGNSEKIDRNSQSKGMTEKTNSGRDSLVAE